MCTRVWSYLVGQTCWLADDPERQRLFVAEGLEVAGDPRPLDLPLPQVVGEPNVINMLYTPRSDTMTC